MSNPVVTKPANPVVKVRFNDDFSLAAVPSSKGDREYLVKLADGSAFACRCADHQRSFQTCKHMLAAQNAHWVCARLGKHSASVELVPQRRPRR